MRSIHSFADPVTLTSEPLSICSQARHSLSSELENRTKLDIRRSIGEKASNW